MNADPNSGAGVELLLAHEAWVRQLAQRMAGDPHRADDLAQNTWLAVLGARWRRTSSPRAFLAGVLRRRDRFERRTHGRRREHEAQVAPKGDVPSAVDALERAEMARELSRLLVELEEPFRSVVLLKIQTERSAASIAAELGISVKTVESRLARGLARLRERWRRRHPHDAFACLALLGGHARVPLATSASTASTALSSGALIVNTKLVLASLAIAGGGGLAYLALASPSEPTHGAAPELANTSVDEAARAHDPVLPVDEVRAARVAEAAPTTAVPATPPDVEPDAAAALRTLRGRVVDPEGRSLAAMPVTFRTHDGETTRGLSDARGVFELSAPRAAGRVRTDDPLFEDLFELALRAKDGAEREDELLLVAARHRALAGVVVDEFGAPMRGVGVALELPPGFSARFDAVFDTADDGEWRAETDEDGRFELDRVPAVLDAAVVARLDGYAPGSVMPPLGPALDLELVLRRPGSNAATVEGRVVDAARVPVEGALVSLGALATTTAADGTFVLDRAKAFDSFELVAGCAGHLPARMRAWPDASGDPVWPDRVELVLGDTPLELSGRVVDASGAPLAGLHVWIDDPTSFGIIGDDLTVQLENLVAPAESTYDDSSDDYFRWTPTDARGRFRLQGLLDREYTLGILDPDGASITRHGPFAAGRADLAIERTTREPRRIAGRIVSPAGAPLEGVHVKLHCPMFGGVHHPHSTALTDADGRFAFEDITGDRLTLWIRGEFVLPTLENIVDDEVELVVEALCHVKVHLTSDPHLADAFELHDANGERLPLSDIGPRSYRTNTRWPLIDGRSVALGVSDRARELVLLRGGIEVDRVTISLRPGRLEIVTR